jgi:hypothetical protein
MQRIMKSPPLLSPKAISDEEGQFFFASAALQSPASEVTIDTKRSQNVLRSLHQQRPRMRIALFADVQLRLAFSRVPESWLQSQIAVSGSYGSDMRSSRARGWLDQRPTAASLAAKLLPIPRELDSRGNLVDDQFPGRHFSKWRFPWRAPGTRIHVRLRSRTKVT